MASIQHPSRLDPRPNELIDRSKTIEFEFNGRPIQAYAGDTLGSALYASGVRIFSRSFKFHRARGLMCVTGNCPNCLMTVDGIPNIRACVQRVEEGMRVKGQNAWPGLERDLLSIIDRFRWALPIGFYYKGLYRPRLLWNLSSSIIRRMAGLGTVDSSAKHRSTNLHLYTHTGVAVIGGGIAGMNAALEAARAGARVTLIDDQPNLGRSLHHGTPREPQGEDAESLVEQIRSEKRIEVISDATVFGLYEGDLLGIRVRDIRRGRLLHLRAQEVIIAAGTQEVPLTFERNDLSGVMLSTAARRLVNLYAVKPGNTALVATTNDEAYYAALDMLGAGMRIAAIADTRPEFRRDLEPAAALRANGVLILPNYAIARAEGTRTVIGGIVAEIGRDGEVTRNERQFDCDIIAMSGGFHPSTTPLHQVDTGFAHSTELDEYVPVRLSESVQAAGRVTGIYDPAISALQGKAAGLTAARSLGSLEDESRLSALERSLAEETARYRKRVQSAAAPIDPASGPRQFVCFCEDILVKDIGRGVSEGFEDVQMLKRYSTATMGPCQGKMCHKRFAEVLSKETGRSLQEVGSTTTRPPVRPLTLEELAGPMYLPFKRTPIHHRHVQANASIVETAGWQRPYSYGDPQAEAAAVRQRVGIIDIGTLGKIDIQGGDAGEILDFVYTRRFSDLRPGRVRYGILTADNGTIMDDGTVARLSKNRYYITTATSNVEMVEQWFKWWMADREMCAHITNITSGYSVINLAGPNARDTLSKLTDIDLTPQKFRYMTVREGDVAGVPSMLLKVGFVGELGWEVHCPAQYGEHMWDALLEAGAEFDISPFGLEAQRILRLEKMHIIPSQDTDVLTTPFDIGADWAVKFDRGEFVGAGGLRIASERGSRDRLVGFVMQDDAVPHDGDAVVDDNDWPIGCVTSSRLSPTIHKGFGLVRVPTEYAAEGESIRIWSEGRAHNAAVTLRPVYDPDGEKIRA